MVLDIEDFIGAHPGGKFVLKESIGHDISKYFYGGYCMEDNLGVRIPAQGHTHSNYAKVTVNDLVIATYERENLAVDDIRVRVNSERTHKINSTTSTVFLRADSGKPIFREWSDDIKMIGKHWKVTSSLNNSVTRHYTVANVMNPRVYRDFLCALRSGDSSVIDKWQNDVHSQDQVLTVKNYN